MRHQKLLSDTTHTDGRKLIKGASFTVTVKLSGFAALWVPERIWGGEQKIRRLGRGRVKLSFTAYSKPEVTAWILSLGNEAHVVGPAWLREDIAAIVKAQHLTYSREKQLGSRGAGNHKASVDCRQIGGWKWQRYSALRSRFSGVHHPTACPLLVFNL